MLVVSGSRAQSSHSFFDHPRGFGLRGGGGGKGLDAIRCPHNGHVVLRWYAWYILYASRSSRHPEIPG